MASKDDKKRRAEALKIRTATKKYLSAIEGVSRENPVAKKAQKNFTKETNQYDSWRDKNPFDVSRRKSQHDRSKRNLKSIRDGFKEFEQEGGERRRQRAMNPTIKKSKRK